MKTFDTPINQRSPLRERPSWQVTCLLKKREPFGTVSSKARYELAADNEEEARHAVRDYVQQTQPHSIIQSIQVTRQAWAQSA